jgi:hypothetical protein
MVLSCKHWKETAEMKLKVLILCVYNFDANYVSIKTSVSFNIESIEIYTLYIKHGHSHEKEFDYISYNYIQNKMKIVYTHSNLPCIW